LNRPIFHHFPITENSALLKCRQFSVLGFTRGSLGSVCSTTELRPLVVSDCTQELMQGTKYALVVGKTVYTLEGHEAELDKYAAQKVTVKGTLKGETLTVESVLPAK
jgi:hypothetical protein